MHLYLYSSLDVLYIPKTFGVVIAQALPYILLLGSSQYAFYSVFSSCSHSPYSGLCTDSEGWFFGTSQTSGTSGLYPGNYVEKTKDSDCWTMHR